MDNTYKLPVANERLNQKVNLDWLILCLKEYHIPNALSVIQGLTTPQTKIVVIRNGLDHLVPFKKLFPKNDMAACLINCAIEPNKNGYIQKSNAKLILNDSKLSNEFVSLFKENQIEIELSSDFKTAVWKKLIESSAIGGLTAITLNTLSIFSNPHYLHLYKELIKEGIDVAIADGAEIDDGFLIELLLKLETYPQDKGSSMLTDRLLGRPIELNAKNGCIVQKGIELNIEVPIHARVVLALTN
ncbi:MAG: hypothetical protein HKO66_12585 [Saprospiraceae bacterium]|nr:hypothetical protein [Bacteroidia bacterium]NNE13557.1 hypothetical protein [Saprospiraceae bacterium]NNL93067.1 hypothetical protein [Saprospiraceae bacterium]